MVGSAHDTIEEAFVSSLSDLIECYTGGPPEIIVEPDHDRSETAAAIVGFGEAGFSGSAVLVATEEIAAVLSETTPLNPIDWLGELCNQLVGRLKNRLSKYGLLPQMGTPVTVRGQHLDLGTVSSKPTAWRVSWSDGSLHALLVIEVQDDLELVLDDSAVTAEEGSLNLF